MIRSERVAGDEYLPRRSTGVTHPDERGFVLQVAPDCDLAAGRLSGRIAHLRTSDGGNFDSVESLLALLWRVLERSGGQDR